MILRATASPTAGDLPLPAKQSAAFVALATEIDNAVEQHIAHRTGSTG